MNSQRRRLLVVVALIAVVAIGATIGVPRYTAARRAAQPQLTVDLSAPLADGYGVEVTVVPVSSDWALLYLADAKRLAEPEPGRIYSVNLKTGKLSNQFIVTGRIVSVGSAAHSDGTASLLINTDGKHGLIFVDPATLAVTRQALPETLDIWNLVVSPDKRKVAYTLYDGAYVANLDFSDPRCLLPRDRGPSDSEMDDELARVNDWSTDGKQIVYWRCGYEWLIGAGICDVSSGQDRFVPLTDKAGYLVAGNRLLVHDVLGYDTPDTGFGAVNLADATPAYREVAKWGSIADSVDFGHDGKYVALCTSMPTAQARVLSAATGDVVAALTPAAGLRAYSIVLAPAGDVAMLVTGEESYGYRPSLVIWRFLNELSK